MNFSIAPCQTLDAFRLAVEEKQESYSDYKVQGGW